MEPMRAEQLIHFVLNYTEKSFPTAEDHQIRSAKTKQSFNELWGDLLMRQRTKPKETFQFTFAQWASVRVRGLSILAGSG